MTICRIPTKTILGIPTRAGSNLAHGDGFSIARMNPTAPKLLAVSDRHLKDTTPYAKFYEYPQTRSLPSTIGLLKATGLLKRKQHTNFKV